MLVVAGLAVVATAAWSARHQRATGSRWTAQLVSGLVCGVASAVAVAVPFVDVVPDAEEGLVAVGGVLLVAAVGVGIAVALGGRARRERAQLPRS